MRSSRAGDDHFERHEQIQQSRAKETHDGEEARKKELEPYSKNSLHRT